MEHFECPLDATSIHHSNVTRRRAAITTLHSKLSGHRLYDHPLSIALGDNLYGPDALRFVLTHLSTMIEPYTGLLGLLLGRAPDLKSRQVLLDNLFEEMGRGDVSQAHPVLWRGLLDSIGVSDTARAELKPLESTVAMNAGLEQAFLFKPFVYGCAWLSFSEAPIPNLFSYLVQGTYKAFGRESIDHRFFDRHGVRDEGHSDDADLLIAVHATPILMMGLACEARACLDARVAVWDELEYYCRRQQFDLLRREDDPPPVMMRAF